MTSELVVKENQPDLPAILAGATTPAVRNRVEQFFPASSNRGSAGGSPAYATRLTARTSGHSWNSWGWPGQTKPWNSCGSPFKKCRGSALAA